MYSSAVLLPQLSQEVLNYNSTLAGLVLSPGAVLVCFTIPIVQRVMGFVATKYIVAFGFFAMGLGMVYSMQLVPTIDYDTLAKMRAAQSFGIALLFVPISTLAYVTLPKELNGDAAALYTMFRNVSGSIGISLSTAMVTERTQVRTAHLVTHLNPFNPRLQPDHPAVSAGAALVRPRGRDDANDGDRANLSAAADPGPGDGLFGRVHVLRGGRVRRRAGRVPVLGVKAKGGGGGH